MGPDKSPGPDGMTARFLQCNWDVLGPDIVQQIQHAFNQGNIPEDWLNCKVSLVPKMTEPEDPKDYRPISVGNMLYRLVMKLVAHRLRPYLKKVISKEQNAFLSGRNITDSIIVVKEILHSFKQHNFKTKAYLLKADISKAFDKLNWQFLYESMRFLNVPDMIITMMSSGFSRARVSININGNMSGFITPTRGLRQGCPMSPYAFIMAMEMLTRLMGQLQVEGRLSGVKLARTSPAITHLIYADDLVVLGNTEKNELQNIIDAFSLFGHASGLEMNPAKSKVWFSKSCQQEHIHMTLNALQVDPAGESEKYLGALLVDGRSAKKTGQMLLERMQAKLTGWKMNMLSHAGRLVLIKSVLMSLPVYYMTIESIPKTIIQAMNSLMAKFFWGKTGQARYMALVAWRKICTPIQEGGLGIRNLQKFGEALMMKLAWAVISQHDKPWVQICRAKYCPRIGVWNAKEPSSSSPMWKHILRNKEFFRADVMWRLGDATKVPSCSQPWFPGWINQRVIPREDISPRVAELFDFEANQWNADQLSQLFQQELIPQIQTLVQKPVRNSLAEDCLIWGRSKSGRYTVKEGYRLMVQGQGGQLQPEQCLLWEEISNWKGILPKIKIFLWRLISRALMLAPNMHRRMPRWSPTCQRCNLENEYETHCFFFCPGSRAVWFCSNFGLRTHDLSLNIVQAIKQCVQGRTEEEVVFFSMMMWEIWKGRNATVINHKKFDPVEINMKVKHALQLQRQCGLEKNANRSMTGKIKYQYSAAGWQIILDGSWDTSNKAGCAYLIFQRGKIWKIGYSCHTLQNPFHAEAVALKEALMIIHEGRDSGGGEEIEVYTDCQELVKAVMERDVSNLSSWQAMEEMQQIIQIVNENQPAIWIKKVGRNAVQQAHKLANHARRNTVHYIGVPRAANEIEREIEGSLNETCFQRVPEAPP
ncbi:RNA-directed DNA polymerase (reverse transcriptase)-related family protein [Rhynchospora pubera]|uniref:RNA-directed DNA polymerase (Reverse transcriptase)-related family protein n=1 Tax=Rhynchospora pubera TaxID=906938 RepID=A0AAV8H4T0_9POAL|nr:RNA-directed DNA polymerase (reverse transcriptase)-related family protein [Rhynchospora pubera]